MASLLAKIAEKFPFTLGIFTSSHFCLGSLWGRETVHFPAAQVCCDRGRNIMGRPRRALKHWSDYWRVNAAVSDRTFFLRSGLSLGALNPCHNASPAWITNTENYPHKIPVNCSSFGVHRWTQRHWYVLTSLFHRCVLQGVLFRNANNVSDSLSRVYFVALSHSCGLYVPALIRCPHLEHSKILSCFCIRNFYNYLIPWGLQNCSLQPAWVTS